MEERTQLNSWKEIAAYLDVSIRTAQLWEKERGMPVRRLPSDKENASGRVFAYVDELRAWLDSGAVEPLAVGAPPESAVAEPPAPAPRHRTRWVAAGALAALTLVAAYLLLAGASSDREPAGWKVANHTLVVSALDGTELWRRGFDLELDTVAYQRQAIQPQFLDLDGDGDLEVLFVVATADTRQSYRLMAFSAAGEPLWSFTPGGPVRTLTEGFEDTYLIAHAAPLYLGTASARGIAVVSHQIAYYPTQIAVLDAGGRLTAEYWHAGRVGVPNGTLRIADMDGDGWSEIYAGGVSNARNLATLVALDPREMSGASLEDDPDYQFVGLGPGVEIGRVFFPRSPVSLAGAGRYNVVSSVLAGPNFLTAGTLEDVQASAGAGLQYRLSPDLEVLDVTEDDGYRAAILRLPESERPGPSLTATLAAGVVVERPQSP